MVKFQTASAVLASIFAIAFGLSAQPSKADDTPGEIKAIVGSTITAVGESGEVVMFIAPDHSIDVMKGGRRQKDTWSVRDGKFCIGQERTCAKVTVTGAKGTLDYEGHPFAFTMEAGNQVAAHAADR